MAENPLNDAQKRVFKVASMIFAKEIGDFGNYVRDDDCASIHRATGEAKSAITAAIIFEHIFSGALDTMDI